MMMPLNDIKSLNDVKLLVRWFTYDQKIAFHPDTSALEYINLENNEPFFNNSESRKLQKLLDKAFIQCEIDRTDIYTIGLPILQKAHENYYIK